MTTQEDILENIPENIVIETIPVSTLHSQAEEGTTLSNKETIP